VNFGFSDHYGHDWDAFKDSWGDVEPTLPSPAAILWHRADTAAGVTLQPFSECISELMRVSDEMRARPEPKQLVLFLFGVESSSLVLERRTDP